MGFLDSLKATTAYCPKCGKKRTEVILDWGQKETGQTTLICEACLAAERRQRVKEAMRPRGDVGKLRERIKKDPSNAENYYNLSKCITPNPSEKEYYSVSRIDESCDLLVKALAIGLSDPLQKGTAYFTLALLREPCKIWIDTSDNSIRFTFVSTLSKQYLRAAAKEFRLALSYDSDNVDVLEKLKVIYRALKRRDELDETEARLAEAKARQSIGLSSKNHKEPLSRAQKGINFEQKCMQIIQSMGFSTHSTKTVADGGIDIVAVSNQPLTQGRYIVQCKNWKKPVGEPIVRDLYGVVASDNAVKGILISSSGFTASAVNFAKGKRLELIDGDQLDYLSSLANEKD